MEEKERAPAKTASVRNNPRTKPYSGARNQHKTRQLAQWLQHTFPDLLREGRTVLDVAGGKGELAARLVICMRCNVIVVEPREVDLVQTFTSRILPRLPKARRTSLETRMSENGEFLQGVFQEKSTHIPVFFTDKTAQGELLPHIQRADLMLGIHADSATEAIVDAALRSNTPFLVVPCCVFPSFFPGRVVDGAPVKTTEDLCEYLLRKDSRFQKATMPFEGRNTGIYWDGT